MRSKQHESHATEVDRPATASLPFFCFESLAVDALVGCVYDALASVATISAGFFSTYSGLPLVRLRPHHPNVPIILDASSLQTSIPN